MIEQHHTTPELLPGEPIVLESECSDEVDGKSSAATKSRTSYQLESILRIPSRFPHVRLLAGPNEASSAHVLSNGYVMDTDYYCLLVPLGSCGQNCVSGCSTTIPPALGSFRRIHWTEATPHSPPRGTRELIKLENRFTGHRVSKPAGLVLFPNPPQNEDTRA